jgi:magnesium transporter
LYAAAAHGHESWIESNAGPCMINGWLEHQVDQLWLDLESPDAAALEYLRERFQLHPLAVEECDHTGVRPKIEEFDGHLYIVLHGVNHNEGQDRLDPVEFRFFLKRDLLITIHDKPSRSIRKAQDRLKQDPHLLERSGVDSVLHLIVDAVVDHYFPILEGLEARLEKLEGEVFHRPNPSVLEELLTLQRKFLRLQRVIHPQLDILGALSSGRFGEIDAADTAYFRDVYDHLQRISDRLHVAREMLAGAMQCYLSQISNRNNGVMKSLAVLATILLPATLLTNMLSMNIQHLPGRDGPETFWIVLGVSSATSAVLLAALHRLRWL